MNNDRTRLPCPELPGEPIWLAGGGEADEYADFLPEYGLEEPGVYTLRIACDTDYNLFLDGELIGFGQYADYPGRVVYDEYDLPAKPGSSLFIRAWHARVECFTHKKREAYAVVALFRDGLPVPGGCSSLRTLSRPSPEYIPHRKRSVTGQMGLGFSLTAAASPENPAPSARAEICVAEVLRRPTHKLTLGVPMTGTLIDKGVYVLPAEGNDSRRMDAAVPADMPGKANSFFMLFDFGRETVGFPRIEFDLPAGGPCLVGWGEHVTDGRCRTAIGSRDFSFSCEAAAGHSLFFPALRRIGCRYVEIFFPAEPSSVKVELVPAEYPVRQLPPPSFSSREKGPDGASAARRERIYDTAVHTLRCCMHEHYEDCPWREQALYTLDSRNQMLAGYSVFEDGNREMVRASLDLISRGVREDGLLSLCFPAGLDRPIPLYTLAYFLQFNEYLKFSNDFAFAREKYPVLRGLIETVLSRLGSNPEYPDLVPRYPDSRGYWNFYEWSPGMSGSRYEHDEKNPPAEAPFNAFLVLALRAMADVSDSAGKTDGDRYRKQAELTRKAVLRVFSRSDGLFDSFTDRKDLPPSVLTQALCL
ncbi:MAG: hypothetical protein J6V01_01580, partial [Clostridia bacterium]|nr:hypothetical protein [Clostridia bacterium]